MLYRIFKMASQRYVLRESRILAFVHNELKLSQSIVPDSRLDQCAMLPFLSKQKTVVKHSVFFTNAQQIRVFMWVITVYVLTDTPLPLVCLF